MNSKEKAKDLVEHYAETIDPIVFGVLQERNWKLAKKCALIAIDEMIILNGELYLKSPELKVIEFYKEQNAYLFEVKQEIFQL